MKTTKRTLWKLLIVCIALMMSVGGTIAYLTDTDGDVNVMTLGRVEIDLIEQERVPGGYVDFQDDHPLIPGVYPELETGEDGFWPESVHNAVDKIVTVKNIGPSDAYVRLWFAFEVTGENNFFQDKIHLNRNQDANDWQWKTLEGTLTQGDEQYVVAVATHPHVLPKDATTPVSLRQVLLDSSATNEDVAALGEKYSILVVAQGVQASGFNSAEQALTGGFGQVNLDNHPFKGMTTGESYVAVTKDGLMKVLNNTQMGGKQNVVGVTFGRVSEYDVLMESATGSAPVQEAQNATGALPVLFATAYAEDESGVKAYYVPAGTNSQGAQMYHVYVLAEGKIKLHKDCDQLMGDFGNLEVFAATNLDASDVKQMKNFYKGCTNLTVVTVPDGVEVIPEKMFADCESLEVVEIPGTVTEINKNAFNSKKENVYLIVVPDSAAEEWGDENKGFTTTNWPFTWWVEDDEYIHITKYIGTAAEVVVPEEIDGLPVRVLGSNSFTTMRHLNVVTSVELPDTLRRADYGVFVGCDKLRSISIPASLSYIPRGFLDGCSALESIIIPEGVVKIEAGAFNGCEKLKSVSIPSTVTHIGYRAFNGCSNLESVILPSGLTHIGQEAFSGTKVRSLTIPDTVTWLGDSAFAGMKELRELTIPSSVKDFGENCFPSSDVTLYVAPDSPAEEYCKENALTYTQIGGSVVTPAPGQTPKPTTPPPANPADVGNYRYAELDGYVIIEKHNDPAGGVVTDVEVPGWLNGKPVRIIGADAFAFKGHLKSVKLPEEGLWEIENTAFCESNALSSINLPDSIINIGREAFSNCRGLTSIHIPTGLSVLNEGVFHGCSGLQEVKIPGNVKRIERNAFRDCHGLQSITIEEGVQTIATRAFQNCTNLKTINIPRSVTSIQDGAFDGSNLVRITVYEGTVGHEYCVEQKLNYRLLDKNGQHIMDSEPTPVPTPDVTPAPEKPSEDFEWHEATDEVPFSWYRMNNEIFVGKYEGTASEVEFPSHLGGLPVTVLRLNTFANMSHIQKVKLPDTLTTIEGWIFGDCRNMTECKIPGSVTFIGDGAFYGCNSLESVTIPAGVTEILDSTFGWCESLTKVIIPGTVKTVGNEAFHNCHAMTTVVIEEGVKELGAQVFNECKGLTSVYFPASIEKIDADIFISCGDQVTAYVYENSVAHTYCDTNDIDYVLLDENGNPIPTPTPAPTPDSGEGGDSGDEAQWFEPTAQYPFKWCKWELGTEYDHAEIHAYVEEYNNTGHVTVPSTLGGLPVTVIVENSFNGKTTLESVTISENVTYIGAHAFQQCAKLESVSLPSSITYIDQQAFANCNLKSFTVPEKVEVITVFMLGGNANLNSVTLHDNVKEIQSGAFQGCPSLTDITLPASVTTIGEAAFADTITIHAPKGSYAETWCASNNINFQPLSN